MNRFSKEKIPWQKNRWWNKTWFFLLIFILMIISVRSAFSAFSKYKISNEKYDKFSDEYTKLKEKKERLESTISKMETERGIEEEIRDRFDAVREGEHLIVVSE